MAVVNHPLVVGFIAFIAVGTTFLQVGIEQGIIPAVAFLVGVGLVWSLKGLVGVLLMGIIGGGE